MAKQPNQKELSKKHLARLEKERRQRRYLIIGSVAVIVIVVGIILYGILSQTVLKNIRPVAKVGNQTITTAQFQKEVRFQRYQLINQLTQMTSDQMYIQFFASYIQQIQSQLESPTVLGQQTIDSMVEDAVVAQYAKAHNITVSDAELNKAFQDAFGYYPNGTDTPTVTSTPYNTPTLNSQQETLLPPTATPTITLTPTVTQTPTGTPPTPVPTETLTPTPAGSPTVTQTPTITLTPTPFTTQAFSTRVNTYLTSVKSIGYSEADLKDLIRRQLLRQKVYNAITKDVPKVQEQVWARHILVANETDAKKVEDALKAGGNFAELAQQYSTDTGTKDQGGDLGWFPKGTMVAEFEDAAFKLKVGEISAPVKTTYGYHIIQVLGRENRPLTDTQLQQAQQKAYSDWLTAQKKALNVQTYDTTWTQAVPTDPAIPANVQSILSQLQQSQQPLPAAIPTNAPAETATP